MLPYTLHLKLNCFQPPLFNLLSLFLRVKSTKLSWTWALYLTIIIYEVMEENGKLQEIYWKILIWLFWQCMSNIGWSLKYYIINVLCDCISVFPYVVAAYDTLNGWKQMDTSFTSRMREIGLVKAMGRFRVFALGSGKKRGRNILTYWQHFWRIYDLDLQTLRSVAGRCNPEKPPNFVRLRNILSKERWFRVWDLGFCDSSSRCFRIN